MARVLCLFASTTKTKKKTLKLKRQTRKLEDCFSYLLSGAVTIYRSIRKRPLNEKCTKILEEIQMNEQLKTLKTVGTQRSSNEKSGILTAVQKGQQR